MLFSFRSKPSYTYLAEADGDEELKVGGHPHPVVRYTNAVQGGLGRVVGLSLLAGLSFLSAYLFFSGHVNNSTCPAAPSVSCVRPSIRREWRTLSRADKNDYITAVQCLGTKPSKVRENGTLYDDFPRVHKSIAAKAHASAPFFPWHRYYIHSYEKALKEDCAYGGNLPYWDWSQDWQNFHNAPVWSSESGFGGDGDINGAITVGEGRCVTNGPFAGLEAMFYDDHVQPHCLSRGFQKGAQMEELAKLIRPEVIEDLMREEEYEKFAPELESRAHRFIRDGVRGDFSKFTGPYDPVFFLHHVNLDRLWAQWQQTDPLRKLTAYGGRAHSLTEEPASLADMLDVGGLLESVPVSAVMETTSGMFCYQY